MNFATIQLNPIHKKANFNCGQRLLDNYISTQAKQDIKRKLTACFVLANESEEIKGYYTLSSASIAMELLPNAIIEKLPPSYSNLPVTLLGRLAVDTKYKRQGIGELLLIDALKRSYLASVNSVGSMAVVVDPIDNEAIVFYLKYGFIELPDSNKMFIAMETISKLF